MKKQIISLFLVCCIIFTVVCSDYGDVKAKAGNRNYYVTYEGSRTIQIKNGKVIVTGKFYDMELKEPWKSPKVMKKKKFSISKNVRFEEETEETNGKISKHNFLKKYKKFYTVGFEVKNGKVVMMFYSVFEPQF